jgi:hypothetical protein
MDEFHKNKGKSTPTEELKSRPKKPKPVVEQNGACLVVLAASCITRRLSSADDPKERKCAFCRQRSLDSISHCTEVPIEDELVGPFTGLKYAAPVTCTVCHIANY